MVRLVSLIDIGKTERHLLSETLSIGGCPLECGGTGFGVPCNPADDEDFLGPARPSQNDKENEENNLLHIDLFWYSLLRDVLSAVSAVGRGIGSISFGCFSANARYTLTFVPKPGMLSTFMLPR